jgi:uncharacterized membrane protein YhiD involved in acid resistance
MAAIDFGDALRGGNLDVPHLWQLIVRMALASLLGAFIAFRPWRRLIKKTPKPALQGAQAQTLIAAAGALLVVVIRDNIALAFGLVGLGAFIRFRSGISDPRDAATLLVVVGVGMACGLWLPWMAIAGTAFVCLLLAIFDATGKKRTRASLYAADASVVLEHFTSMFPDAKVLDLQTGKVDSGKDVQKLVVELDLDVGADAATIRRMLDAKSVPGVTRVAIED